MKPDVAPALVVMLGMSELLDGTGSLLLKAQPREADIYSSRAATAASLDDPDSLLLGLNCGKRTFVQRWPNYAFETSMTLDVAVARCSKRHVRFCNYRC